MSLPVNFSHACMSIVVVDWRCRSSKLTGVLLVRTCTNDVLPFCFKKSALEMRMMMSANPM